MKNQVSEEQKCPKCNEALAKVSVPGKKMVFKCDEHGLFRLKIKRQKDMSDPKNWRSTCIECGGVMDYYNLRYCCRKCGHILEV